MAVVLATVALAVPRDAWLPLSAGPADAAEWQRVPSGPMAWLANGQIRLGQTLLPGDPVGGAIAVAAGTSAAATGVLAVVLRSAGLSSLLAALLALVAVAAPVGGWQAASPLAAGPAALASACLLYITVRRGTSVRVRHGGRLVVALALLIVGAELVGGGAAARTAATLRLLHGDLGLPGLVLLAAAAARVDGGLAAPVRVWLGCGALWLVTLPFGSDVRAAALLPWAWWLVGAGLADVLTWRGPRAARWAVTGVAIWVALHAARLPWTHQRQQAALVRTWAEGLVPRLGAAAPLVSGGSAQDRLLDALVRQRAPSSDAPAVVSLAQAYAAVQAGQRAMVTTATAVDRLRWQGLAFGTPAEGAGSALDRLLGALPPDTVVLAAISADAAAAMTPTHWQALGRVGLRLADAGAPRAHALVGITGARVDALEAAQAGAVRLDVQPGDPLGRTGTRAPVDARLDAGQSRVSLTLRGRPYLTDEPGLVLVFLSTRGEFLGWRAGRSPAHLDGAPLGAAPDARVDAIAALPCLDLPGDGATDITRLASTGALGVTWPSAGRLDLALTRRPDHDNRDVRLADTAADVRGVQLRRASAPPAIVTLEAAHALSTGIDLRGAVTQASVSASAPVRLCGAWPMPRALDLARLPLALGIAPRDDARLGDGWHDAEGQIEGGFFRWMSGPRADLLLPLRTPLSLSLSVDAQAPATPAPTDDVRLLVNGRDLGPRALLPTRGLYTFVIPAEALRAGMNTLTLVTTRAVRPADQSPGADARRLGLLVRGFTLDAAPANARK